MNMIIKVAEGKENILKVSGKQTIPGGHRLGITNLLPEHLLEGLHQLFSVIQHGLHAAQHAHQTLLSFDELLRVL